MKVSADLVRNVAKLAHLELSESEVESLAVDMDKILSYVEKLSELDTQGVEPTSQVVAMDTPFRADEVTSTPAVDDALANAPERDGEFFVVPSIIE